LALVICRPDEHSGACDLSGLLQACCDGMEW
jgi:hypothetical protein